MNTLFQVKQYISRNRRRRVWHKVVGALACLVVFVTTYMLILPAITMEHQTYCGLEEHYHTDECYERRLICGYDDEMPHVHTPECYEQREVLVCGQEETPAHTHDESCYEEERTLSCTEEHEHSDDCYEVSRELACGQEENEGHIHGPECYGTEDVLVCGLSEEPHVHTDDCYAYVPPHIIKSLRESGKTTNISSNRKGRAHSQAQTVI